MSQQGPSFPGAPGRIEIKMSRISIDEIRQLSVPERILLVQEVWDSIAASPDTMPVSDEQREELDRRLDNLRKEPSAANSWDEARQRIAATKTE